MNILVIGSGGREPAICRAFSQSPRVLRLFCANGNAGIAELAECVAIKPDEIDALLYFALSNAIDLTFVGGETPLALGIVDEFEKHGLRIVGPNKQASQLESSKAFSKDFMKRHGIPTAAYKTAYSTAEAKEILNAGEFGNSQTPVVVKADGLAAGKGVVVARDRKEAAAAISDLDRIAGSEAASKIILEECLTGREVSLLMFADGTNYSLMPPARDHKRIGEGDSGPNTGGMGTITDASLLTESQTRHIIEKIIEPTLKGCRDEGFPFRGILFLGLMMVEMRPDATPMLLEYNVRFGDPETQSILVRLETDFVEICEAIIDGTLGKTPISWRDGNSATIVLAASGYPEKPRSGDVIFGIENAAAQPGISIFHAGTRLSERAEMAVEYITFGGRVLGVTATADSLPDALKKAYKAVGDISWDGMQYRKDIGK